MVEQDWSYLDYGDKELKIYVSSEIERKKRAYSCKAEPWTVDWLKNNLQAGDVFYDVGANVGTFSLIAAHILDSFEEKGIVAAFEPGFNNYARLCDNVLLNALPIQILTLPVALSSSNGFSQFVYRSTEVGEAKHKMRDEITEEERSAAHTIITCNLPSVTKVFSIPAPSIMKIDVDGAELKVLKGAKGALIEKSVRSILLEVDRKTKDKANTLMERYGYKVKESWVSPRGNGRISYHEYVPA